MRLLIRLLLVLAVALVPVAAVYADGGTHVVQPGETLYRIALNNGVTVDALRAANGLLGNTIYVGQTLVIPGANRIPVVVPSTPDTVPVVVSQPGADSPGTHIVQAGENLFRIGLKYGVSWQALQAANNMPTPFVYSGQTLIIPGSNPITGTVSVPSVPVVSIPSAPTGGGKRFLVDLSDQMLYAYEGDTLVRSTLISSGLWPNVTVLGTYYIYVKYTSQRMVGPGYDLPGVPYVMYFYQGYALHGTYWHNNFGHPMSHGCVNMPTPEAEWAFNWAPVGTPVTVQW
jgi:LysM repeat protein